MAYFMQLRALFGVNPCTTVFALGVAVRVADKAFFCRILPVHFFLKREGDLGGGGVQRQVCHEDCPGLPCALKLEF